MLRSPLVPLLLSALLCASAAADAGQVTDYAPQTNVACPDVASAPLVRVFTPQTQALHPREAAYVDRRLQTVIPAAWQDWLGDGSALGYNLADFGANYSKVGIAVSGGGYRAALFGAGVLSGLDARNASSKSAGTGGLLQIASYLSALSGGSWLAGSLYMNNWPTISDMVSGNGQDMEGWLLDLDLATPDGVNVFTDDNQAFFGSLLWSIYAKANAGLDTSVTDPWARMISYHFLNQTDRSNFFTNDTAHGAGQLWSEIPQTQAWQDFNPPFPLICADSRPVGSNLTTTLAPEPIVYEITPMEFGSWDPNLSAMVNVSYAGTHLSNGTPDNATGCVTGFDQAGFIMGTSASLFNQILDRASNTLAGFGAGDGSALLYVLARQLRTVRTRADDVANWPNPFNNIKPDTFEDSSSRWLELIDGSSNLENIPLGAMFVNARGLDVVVAVDDTANDPTNLWPNGTSLLFSAARMENVLEASHQPFPPIPASSAQFISTGVNQRPTFFGCNPTRNPPEYPLVIYFPNSPPLNGDDPVTNTETFKLSYTPKHTTLFLDQVHANVLGGFTPNTTTPDANFGRCLQCAALDRARYRPANGTAVIPRSAPCAACFAQYCFDPAAPPSAAELPGRRLAFVDPDPQGASAVKGFLAHDKGGLIGGFVGLVALIAVMIGFLIWWKRRTDRIAQYERVSQLHDDPDAAPWRMYSRRSSRSRASRDIDGAAAYELPEHR